MLKEKEWEIEGGKLTYLEGEDGITVTGCKVTASRVAVPDEIGKIPVTRIDRKAFLSRKQLKEIRLPKGLLEIGDWAFAYCSGLTFVWMPRRNLSMGKGVFKDCQALSGIFPLEGETARDRQCGMLLGSVPMKLETEYLFTPGMWEAGSGFVHTMQRYIHFWNSRMRTATARWSTAGKRISCPIWICIWQKGGGRRQGFVFLG